MCTFSQCAVNILMDGSMTVICDITKNLETILSLIFCIYKCGVETRSLHRIDTENQTFCVWQKNLPKMKNTCVFIYFGNLKRRRSRTQFKDLIWKLSDTNLNIIIHDLTQLSLAEGRHPLEGLGLCYCEWSSVKDFTDKIIVTINSNMNNK